MIPDDLCGLNIISIWIASPGPSKSFRDIKPLPEKLGKLPNTWTKYRDKNTEINSAIELLNKSEHK